jgi:hypothetical protein
MKSIVDVQIMVCIDEQGLVQEETNFLKENICYDKAMQIELDEGRTVSNKEFNTMCNALEVEVGPEIKCLDKLKDDFISHFNVDDFLSMSDLVTIRKVNSWTEPRNELFDNGYIPFSSTPLFELTLRCQSPDCQFELDDVIKRYSSRFKSFTFCIYYKDEDYGYSKVHRVKRGKIKPLYDSFRINNYNLRGKFNFLENIPAVLLPKNIYRFLLRQVSSNKVYSK